MIELKYEKYSIINKKYPTQNLDCSDCDMKYCFKDTKKCNNFEYVFKKNKYTWHHAFKWSCETLVGDIFEGKEWGIFDKHDQNILNLAKVIPQDLDKISSNILKYCDVLEMETLGNGLIEKLRWISKFAYESWEEVKQGEEPKYSDPRLLSFEEQQERCRNYFHFDFSIKKPKFEKIDWNNIFRK